MNVCAQKLRLNNENDKYNDNDDESGLSVTSSEDENESDRTVKQKFQITNEKQYGDI
ncbi:unnamed protein product, partial [Rotaria magnacalcarata]